VPVPPRPDWLEKVLPRRTSAAVASPTAPPKGITTTLSAAMAVALQITIPNSNWHSKEFFDINLFISYLHYMCFQKEDSIISYGNQEYYKNEIREMRKKPMSHLVGTGKVNYKERLAT
jgi:hypothetical protein